MWNEGIRNGVQFVDPGWFFLAGFFKVLWFVLIIAMIFGAIRWFKHTGRARAMAWGGREQFRDMWRQGKHEWRNKWQAQGSNHSSDDAMQTARVRLAKSEITPEQFDDLKQQLEIASESDPALKIARQRLASGEISLETFEMIRRALG
jgi:uncharacterized membrane protein